MGPAPVMSTRARRAAQAPDAVGVVPGLRHHAGRLDQDAEQAESGVDLHGIVGVDAELLRAEAVQSLDAVFGVLAVLAHVPFAGRARHAGDGIAMPHHADDVIAGHKAGLGRRLAHAAERFMAEDQAALARRGLAVKARDDLVIGAANAERDRVGENASRSARRRRNVVKPCGIRVRTAGS